MEANFEQFWVNFWPIYAKKRPFWRQKTWRPIWKTLGQILANLCKKKATFSRQNFEQFLANLLKKWPFFLGQKKEANFGSIFGQFMPKKGPFLRQKRGGQFGQTLGQFLANLCKKWPFFLGKKREANFEQFLANLLKKWPFFLSKKMRPILGQFLANLCKKKWPSKESNKWLINWLQNHATSSNNFLLK